MVSHMKLLVTGATGKVGRSFLDAFPGHAKAAGSEVVALCNNRMIDEDSDVRVVRGSLSDPDAVREAMLGITHVLHLAAVKESPDLAIDVAVKGMFLLLEEFRQSSTACQFILIGGDCAVGHIFHGYAEPITEAAPRRAYKGCYALTKVVEEVMLEQYRIQYGIDGTILRAPWIMEKDDFRYALSFGDDQFGGPLWSDLMSPADLELCSGGDMVPVMLDRSGEPLLRNVVHVDDLVAAILVALDNPAAHGELFNIAMNEPVNYGAVGEYLSATRGMRPIEIPTRFHSNWLSNVKARKVLGWSPKIDLAELIERAWTYRRAENDPRIVVYPG